MKKERKNLEYLLALNMKGGSLPEQNGFLNTPFSETVALVWWRFYMYFFPNVLHNTLAGLLLLLYPPPAPRKGISGLFRGEP